MAYLNPAAGFARQSLTVAGAPVAGTDEVQTLTGSGAPAGGTFALGFDGFTTTPLVFNAGTGAVDAALEALPSIGAGGVACAGGPIGVAPMTVTFTAQNGKKGVGLLTLQQNALTGGTNPTVGIVRTTPGVAASGRGAPKGTTATRLDTGVLLINTGTPTAPTWVAVGSQT